MNILYLWLAWVATIEAQIYDPNLFTPGSNLVSNPTFSTPSLGGSMTHFITGGFSGWTCDLNCQMVDIPQLCTSFGVPCSNNYSQGIDLDYAGNFYILSQTIHISNPNQYLLSVEWMPGVAAPIGKTF